LMLFFNLYLFFRGRRVSRERSRIAGLVKNAEQRNNPLQ
jgi:hypothetical protein